MIRLSMKDLFPECLQVLNERQVPLHYKELTKFALERMGIREKSVDLKEESENVREKFLLAGQRGTFYTGKPLCMGAIRHWFKTEQLSLLHADDVVIPGNASSGISGALNMAMRSPTTQIKRHYSSTEELNRVRATGWVLENHISDWFKENWPEFYLPPENNGLWDRPCDHDFRLSINGRIIKVDVSGKNRYGTFGSARNKKATDVHLTCYVAGKDCIWNGVVSGKDFKEQVIPESAMGPVSFIVWLNCHKHGIRYPDVAAKARVSGIAA